MVRVNESSTLDTTNPVDPKIFEKFGKETLEMASRKSTQETLTDIDALKLSDFSEDEAARARALLSARALCKRLEKPWESIARMFWQEVRGYNQWRMRFFY